MHRISLQGIDAEVTAAEGRRLVLAIEDGGIDILHRCGGNARCATCRVEIIDGEPGPVTEAEEARLQRVTGRSECSRLACQVQVRGDLTVRVLRRLSTSPELDDAGPRPIEWPVDRPLPPED
jgi:ferredoxin